MFRPVLIAAILTSPVAAATTVQQDFDAAQALLDAGRAAEARAAFETLLTRFAPNSQGRAATVVRARLGNALIATGDSEAAEPLVTAAIAGFKSDTPQDRDERAVARYDLARAQESRGALDSAAANYRAVLVSKIFPDGEGGDIALRAALARTLIWSDPAEARRLLDGLLALPGDKLGPKSDSLALVQTLRGRVELNNGNPLEARRWFTLAGRSAGGSETTKINVADVRIRGDLALANHKLGRIDEVQKNLAYSGAGGLADEGLTRASEMSVPACAPQTGLATDAVAVVEFSISDDGRVVGVSPIYASRGSGESAVAARDAGPEILFPQAVRRWFWNVAEVAKLDGFWRQAVRVELRCFSDRPSQSPAATAFKAARNAWFERLGVRNLPDLPENDAVALPRIRTELGRRLQADGEQSAQLLPVLMALAGNAAAPEADRLAAAVRWQALAKRYNPPLLVRVTYRLSEIDLEGVPIKTEAATLQFQRQKIAELLANIEAAGDGDSLAAMLVRLRLGELLETMDADAEARRLFQRIANAPATAVAADDPVRTAALLRLSNQAAAARDTATAASTLAATGLSPEQCSLIDIRPQPINTRIGASSFPDEARRWHTGGFARVGYDITVDGKTANVRTIVASPPFVFGPSTERAIAKFEYQPVFRPGNTLGCSGTTKTVHFRVSG